MTTTKLLRYRQTKGSATGRFNLRGGKPVLYSTSWFHKYYKARTVPLESCIFNCWEKRRSKMKRQILISSGSIPRRLRRKVGKTKA